MRNLFRIYLEKPELAGLALLILLAIVFDARSGGAFLSPDNLRGMLGLLPEVGLVSIGVAILMICGEFDLSVGSTFALTPMVASLLIIADVPAFIAVVLGLLVAAAIGLLNGFITLTFAIPSFITTLGMLFIVRSLTVVISGGALGIALWQWSDVQQHGAHTYVKQAVVMDGFSVLITMLIAVAMLLTALVVDGYLARDGSHLIDARRVTLPDGRSVSGASAGDGGPGDESSTNQKK